MYDDLGDGEGTPTGSLTYAVRVGDVANSVARLYLQCRYMATTTQIAKWGNSLGVRLPKAVAREARLDEGDTVDVSVNNGTIVIRPSRPTYSLQELVAKITPRNRHGETDWGEPLGDETW
jgi:antitoxin MazE